MAFIKGYTPWNKGKKGIYSKVGRIHPMFGKKHRKKTIEKMSKTKFELYSNPKNHPRWKGGKENYHRCIARGVMEKHLGRKLKSEENVHHLDHNWRNNFINNLYLFPTSGKHTHYHEVLRGFVREMVRGI